MHVINSIANTHENASDHSFVLEAMVANVVKQCPIFSILQNYVSAFVFLIKVIVNHSYNIWMMQFHMNLNFT